MIEKIKFGAAAVALLCLAASSVTAASLERVPITSFDIAAAITSAGIRVTAEQIEQLSSIPATKPSPRLKLVKLEPMDGYLVKARLQCDSTRICLPFYVLINWQQAQDSRAALASWKESTSAGPRALKKDEILVHSGKNATMIFDGTSIHMTLPVVCLQNGGRGQRVRVASTDRKRTFIAKVEGEGIVRATWGE